MVGALYHHSSSNPTVAKATPEQAKEGCQDPIPYLAQWEHHHRFARTAGKGERNTRIVIGLTASMMVIEIAAGHVFGSMALLADGWHMGTHVTALSITVLAYIYARRHQDDPRYSWDR